MSLVVKLEIHPGGDARRAREIGRAVISNESQLAEVSNYRYRLIDDGASRCGEILNHRRADGAWALVRKMLEALR